MLIKPHANLLPMTHAWETPLLIGWIVIELLVNGVLWKVFQLSVAGQHLIYFASICTSLDCEKNPLLFLFGIQKLFCSFSTSHCLDSSLSPLHFALLRGKIETFGREMHWMFALSEQYSSECPIHCLSAKMSVFISTFKSP